MIGHFQCVNYHFRLETLEGPKYLKCSQLGQREILLYSQHYEGWPWVQIQVPLSVSSVLILHAVNININVIYLQTKTATMVSFTYNVKAFKNHLSLSLAWAQKCQHVLYILLFNMLIADVMQPVTRSHCHTPPRWDLLGSSRQVHMLVGLEF